MESPRGRRLPRARRGRLRTASVLAALPWLIAGLAGRAPAASFFVSNAGNDGNTGRDAQAPWRTLARAQARAGSGDVVLLARGSVFRETAGFGSGNVTLGAYGPANLPRPSINGSVRISRWEKHKGSVYAARVDGKVEHLFVEGKLMMIARFPNQGWLRTDRGTGADLIVDADLAAHPRNSEGYWKGATVRWRRWSWWFETRPVTAYDPAGRLGLGGKSHGSNTGIDSGYYLDGKLEELDAPGEWYLDPGQGKVYLMAPGRGDPNELLVEGSRLERGLSVSGSRVENVAFRHQTGTGLAVSGECLVRGCLFEGIRNTALTAGWGVRGAVVSHNEFRDNLNVAISWNENPENGGSSVIEHNVLTRTGVVPGYGGSGSWHAAGIIIVNGSNVRVRYNRIEETGYAGVILGSEGNHVEYNVLRRTMATLNDGGAVYTNCSRSYIRHNVILGTVGNLESSHPWANLGHGIWPEFLGDFRESVIEGNTVAGSGGFGLFLPNNFDCRIADNVFFDNARGQMELSGMESNSRTNRGSALPYNNTIERNVLYSCDVDQPALLFRPEFDYGRMDGNYFCNPHTTQPISSWGRGGRRWNRGRMSIAEWQGQFPWADRNPRADVDRTRPSGGNPLGTPRLLVNDSPEEREVPLGSGTWRDVDGKGHKGTVTLGPYRSKVLVLVGGSPGRLPPYVLFSEIAGAGASVAKTRRRRPPARAAPRRVPRQGAVEAADASLLARLREELEAGGGPKVHVAAFQKQLAVLSVDRSNTLHLKGGDTEMTMEWSRLALSDRRALALDLLREGEPGDHCLAAFYLLAEGNERGAQEHLARCGGRAGEVLASFEIVPGSGEGRAEDAPARPGREPEKPGRDTRPGPALAEAEREPAEPQVDPELLALYKRGETFFIEGDMERAKAALEEVIARDPGGECGRKAKEFLELVE